MNILAHFSAIPERLAITLAFAQKVADFIGKLKNEYLALTAINRLLLLAVVVQHISRGTMWFNTIIDCELKL